MIWSKCTEAAWVATLVLSATVSATMVAAREPMDNLPESGADLIQASAKPFQLVEWDGSAPLAIERLRGRVVVVRFWTNTCPYCARSLPALQLLAEEFRRESVQFVGVYHSKPRGSERAWEQAVAQGRSWGLSFPIAYDRGWKTLDSWWLAGRDRVPTSPTFVIDPAGRIVHVHPGPELHPSSDSDHRDCNRDFEALRAAILEAVKAAPG